MYISESTARNLISEISAIIDYDINIMNEKGAIIASTNPSRIDQFHEGAYRIIKNNLDELIVYYDNEYTGCKKGINLPIILNQEIVGVIGITGEVSEITKYGNLIRKVAEILIKDLFKLQQITHKEMEKQIFVSSWLNGDIETGAEIEKGIEKYNLLKHSTFVVSVIKVFQNGTQIRPVIIENLNRNGILTTYGNELYITICNLQSAQKCQELISSVLNLHEKSFICAIGTCQSDYEGVPKSYRDAQQVLQIKEIMGCGIYLFDDELFNVIINDIAIDYKLQFIRNVFKECDHKETLEFIDFINVYCNNNGSINSIAAELFIHKNTVQYKINKILLRTGLDPRVFGSLRKLHLAALWYPSVSHLLRNISPEV